MITETNTTEERITRKATKFGNSAHILVPKGWQDEELILVKPKRLDIKEEIIKLIYPYLDKIIAVFLYGSYSREEQEKNSDIDIFIISKEKINIKSKNIDIICIEEKDIKKAIRINPILMYSMIKESKGIINSSYLESLKEIKIEKNNFNDFIDSTALAIKSNEEMIKLEGGKTLLSNSVIYSLILRLRGIFIIKCLLKNEKYSNKLFKEWINKQGNNLEIEKIYKIYQSIRDNKKTTENISIDIVLKLLELLKEEIKKW